MYDPRTPLLCGRGGVFSVFIHGDRLLRVSYSTYTTLDRYLGSRLSCMTQNTHHTSCHRKGVVQCYLITWGPPAAGVYVTGGGDFSEQV